MKMRKLIMAAMLGFLGGCGGYNESTPEGFYKAYVDAWASSDFEKVLSMHFVTDGKPNGMDYSRAHIESEIKDWGNDESGKTPMKTCRKTLREMDGVYYFQNDDKIKVMNAIKGSGGSRENLDPSLTIIKVDGAWKVQDVTGSQTSRQDWIRH